MFKKLMTPKLNNTVRLNGRFLGKQAWRKTSKCFLGIKVGGGATQNLITVFENSVIRPVFHR